MGGTASKGSADDHWPIASWQELVLMTGFSVLLWEYFYVRTLAPAIHKWAAAQKFYPTLEHRSGHMAGRAQDDITLMFVLAFHHMTSGGLTLLGNIYSIPLLFRIGGLLELGFEIADTTSMLRGVWPHIKSKESDTVRFALFAHHLPGLFMIFPLFHTGAYGNVHLRNCASWLLFAGGCSALAGGFVHTRNFDDASEMKQAAFVHLAGGLVFIFARFWAFPMNIYQFIQELEANEIGETWPWIVKAMAMAMMTFNLIMLKLNIRKLSRYVRKAFFGAKLNLDDLIEPVPDLKEE